MKDHHFTLVKIMKELCFKNLYYSKKLLPHVLKDPESFLLSFIELDDSYQQVRIQWTIGKESYSELLEIYLYQADKNDDSILERIFKNKRTMIHEPMKNPNYLLDIHMMLMLCDHSAVRNHLLQLNYSEESFETIFHLLATFLQGYSR